MEKYRYVNIHNIILFLFMAFSCLNQWTLIAWLIIMPLWLLLTRGVDGAIECFIYLQLRSLFSSGIGPEITGTASIIKWILVFGVSGYIFIKTKDTEEAKFRNAVLWIWLFATYLIVAAWLKSSYPLVATFKVLSYVIPFIAIVKGINYTSDNDWIRRIIWPLGIILILSIPLLRSSIGYLRNGVSFQGVFNHPNVYGCMIAIFLAGYLYYKRRLSLSVIVVVAITIMMIIPCRSRTSLITVLIVLIVFLLTQEISRNMKILLVALLGIVVVILIAVDSGLLSGLNNYMFKGYEDNLLFSRENQFERNLNRFLGSPIIGTGFNVPYTSGIRSYSFSFDLVVENGNLILALLGDTGIIGIILFAIVYTKLFLLGKGGIPTIFIAPFVVSMGEMTFFSTNNFGIIMYLFIAIFASQRWNLNQISNEIEQFN